jgi:uncharacterized membrane protein YraQ (UPF0718 family)
MDSLRFGLVLLAQLVPLFLLVSTLVYLVVDLLTPERIQRWLGGGSAYSKVPLATALGAVTPFCTCSTVPIVNGMRLAGVPTAPLVAFLIASPLISPVAMALLWSLMGAEYAVLYTATALGASAMGAVIVARWNAADEPIAAAAEVTVPASSCGCGAKPPAGIEGPSPAMRMSTLAGAAGSATLAMPVVAPAAFATERFRDRIRRAFVRSLRDLRKFAVPLVVAVAIGAAVYGYVPESLIVDLAGPAAAARLDADRQGRGDRRGDRVPDGGKRVQSPGGHTPFPHHPQSSALAHRRRIHGRCDRDRLPVPDGCGVGSLEWRI